jgi:tetratricopeptide (TPR) repeat protein
LGVRYVLEGSVRKAGNRVRIAGQLVDATTGTHIWADRFDGALEDVFELQDRVTNSVVGAISPSIEAAEVEKAQRKPPENLQAYDLVLRALPHMVSMERERLKEAVCLLRQATEIDPTYGLASARLAECMMWTMTQGWSQLTEDEINEMVRLSWTALSYGKDDPEVLSTAACIIGDTGGDLHAGVSLVDKALTLNPNSANALWVSGYLRTHAGDTETAIQHLERGARLNPMERSAVRNNAFSMAYFVAGRYDCAAEFAEKALHDNPFAVPVMRRLAAMYGLLGRAEEAQQMVRRLDVIVPGYTISKYRGYMENTPKGSALLKTLDTFCEGLRRAGMPE